MKLVHIAVLALGVSALAAGAAQAADLLVSDAPLAQQMDSSVYAKLFGGVTAPDTLFFMEPEYDIDAGGLLGAALGVNIGDSGLSLELDATGSTAIYTNEDNSLNAFTLMGNLVFTAGVTDSVSIYGGVGVGGVLVSFDTSPDIYDSEGTAAAGQVFAGVSAKVADNVSLFGEARYQAAFNDVTLSRDSGFSYEAEFHRTSLLGGVKLDF